MVVYSILHFLELRVLKVNAGIAGTVAECQQERSQIKNKEKAMKLLRAKLYSAKLEEETSKRYQARKLQVHYRLRLFFREWFSL